MAGYESNPDTRDLLDMLALSHVPRWCIVPMTRPQTVAEHSYRVAVLVRWMLRTDADEHMLVRALSHDVEEARTGDIPGPAKVRMKNAGPTCPKVLCKDEDLHEAPDHLEWDEEQHDLWASPTSPAGEYSGLALKLADLLETYTYLHAWGRECDHRTRVLTELWREIDEVAGRMDKTKLPCTRAQSWYGVARMVRDAVVYEAR